MPGELLRRRAFISRELLIMLLLVILLAAVALPHFMKRRITASKSACPASLKQIEGAKQQWALAKKKTKTDVPKPSEVAEYLKGGVMPVCPAGGSYTVGAVGAKSTCTIPGHTL